MFIFFSRCFGFFLLASFDSDAFSKRIKWRELEVYSFDLPDLKTQEKIVEVFQQIQTTLDQITSQKQTLKNLKHKLLNEILG